MRRVSETFQKLSIMRDVKSASSAIASLWCVFHTNSYGGLWVLLSATCTRMEVEEELAEQLSSAEEEDDVSGSPAA